MDVSQTDTIDSESAALAKRHFLLLRDRNNETSSRVTIDRDLRKPTYLNLNLPSRTQRMTPIRFRASAEVRYVLIDGIPKIRSPFPLRSGVGSASIIYLMQGKGK